MSDSEAASASDMLGLASLLDPLLDPLDVGFGELPAYNYLLAAALFFVVSVLYRRSVMAAERARRAREEAERSKRVLERPIDPARTFTNEQLKQYDGSRLTSPIYMSVKGIVFDVTSGEGFYGPGAGYAPLAGREASRALAKMETKEMGTDLSDLGAYERQTLDDWFDRFESKYPRVGTLVGRVNTLPAKPVVKRKHKSKPAAAAAGAGAGAGAVSQRTLPCRRSVPLLRPRRRLTRRPPLRPPMRPLRLPLPLRRRTQNRHPPTRRPQRVLSPPLLLRCRRRTQPLRQLRQWMALRRRTRVRLRLRLLRCLRIRRANARRSRSSTDR